ncbi:MAG: PDZ domain-containing protein [Planctomycetota bacterium]|nr:PDZ domain-containing protein [Planctomycetota bacterium]
MQLAVRQLSDGTTESYVLRIEPGAVARLEVVSDGQRERAFLGFRLEAEGAGRSEVARPQPAGVRVMGTYPDSAAARAGVEAGDLLLSVGDASVCNERQLHAAEASLVAAVPVRVRLLHGGREVERTLEPEVLREQVADVQWVELEGSTGPCKYSGIVLRGIPEVWSRRLSGDVGNVVVVAGVDLGSPAWLAGIRAGDSVEAVDGGPVSSVEQVSRLLGHRGREEGVVDLRVRRGGGAPHEARLQLSDYGHVEQVWVPGLFDLEDACGHRAWSAGPFGLLAGGQSRPVAAPGRTAESRGLWHGLFGLVQVDSRGEATQLRLFWVFPFEI